MLSAAGRAAFVAREAPVPGRHLPMQKRLKISPSRSSAVNCAGDLAERIVRQAQLLGQQLERRGALVAERQRALQVLARALQRLHVARAGDEHAFGRRMPAGALQQRLAQCLQALRRCAPTGSMSVAGAPRHQVAAWCARAAAWRRPAAARRSAPRRLRSRPGRGASGRAGRARCRHRRSNPSCARCRCARPRRRSGSRSPAVSITCSGTPSIWIVWLTRSRVVPGIGVTMASSAPASALSSELLPTLGWPASTTRMPSRSKRALLRAVEQRVQRDGDVLQLRPGAGLLQEVDLLLGKVERRLDQHAQAHDALAQALHLLRERAAQRAAGRARRGFGAGVDQVGHGLGLRQVELAVEKRALR